MKEENSSAEAGYIDAEAQDDLKAGNSGHTGDAMLTAGHGGETQRGMKSRHIQFLFVRDYVYCSTLLTFLVRSVVQLALVSLLVRVRSYRRSDLRPY